MAPAIVAAGLILLVAPVVGWEDFSHRLGTQLDAERATLALRRRRVQGLLDEFVAPGPSKRLFPI